MLIPGRIVWFLGPVVGGPAWAVLGGAAVVTATAFGTGLYLGQYLTKPAPDEQITDERIERIVKRVMNEYVEAYLDAQDVSRLG